MGVIEWLKQGDICINYLVSRYLEEKKVVQRNKGYIKTYLQKYDKETKMWGKGLYSPKWISSTYTLLDLVNLEAAIDPRMVEAYEVLRAKLVKIYTLNPADKRTLDLCIVGMLIKIGSYLKVDIETHKELIDFVIYTVNEDGAWNCYYNYRDYSTSSLHTTINILEGLALYKQNGYTYRINELDKLIQSSEEFILKKKLFRSRRTNHLIHESFIEIHYPVRWKYDIFRAMEYFCDVKKAYDQRMDEAMSYIQKYLLKGIVPKGKTYQGQVHFKMELDDFRRINTLRLLRIVKYYDEDFYHKLIAYNL